MVKELIIFLTIFLCGYFAQRLLIKDNFNFKIFASYPIGFGIYFLVFLVINIFNITAVPTDNKALLFAFVYLLIAIMLISVSLKNASISKKELKYLGYTIIVILIVTFFANYYKPAIVNTDPKFVLPIENKLGFTLNEGWPIFGVAIQFLGQLLHYNTIFGHFNIYISISLGGLMGVIIYRVINQRLTSSYKALFICALPAILFFTTFIGYFHFFWMKNHIITAGFYLIAIFSLQQFIKNKNYNFIYLLQFSLLMLIFTRMEGYLFSVFFIFFFLRHKEIPLSAGKHVAATHFFLSLPWIIYMIYNSWGVDSIINSNLNIISFIIFLCVYFLFILKGKNHLLGKITWKISSLHIIVFFIMLLTLFTLLKPQHMVESFNALLLNLFWKPGKWIPFWYFFIPIALFLVLKYRVWISDEFIHLLPSFFISSYLFCISLVFFRGPLRADMNDSVNRMLIHSTPILLVWVFIMLVRLFETTNYQENIRS